MKPAPNTTMGFPHKTATSIPFPVDLAYIYIFFTLLATTWESAADENGSE